MNTKQWSGKWIYLFEFYIYAFNCNIVTMVLCFLCSLCFNDYFILLNILCKYYASYASHIYIYISYRWSRQDSSWLCLSIGRHVLWIQVPTPVQLMLPHFWQVKWGVIINIQWHRGGELPRQQQILWCRNSRNWQIQYNYLYVAMYISWERISYLGLVLVHGIHLYHWYFWQQVHIPWVLQNGFKSGKARIDFKVSQMFRKVYESFYGIVQP